MDEFYVHKCESQCEILKNNIINLDNDEKEIFSFTLINDVYEEISKSDTKVDVNTIYMPCLKYIYFILFYFILFYSICTLYLIFNYLFYFILFYSTCTLYLIFYYLFYFI